MRLERLVVGIDFSTYSMEAANWVANHFAPGAELVLLHVISSPAAPLVDRSGFPRRSPSLDPVRAGAEKRLREIGVSLKADFVWREIREGDPAACFAQVAREFFADAIVVGARAERRGAQKALGTTAEQLVRASPCPVLVVTHPRRTPLTDRLVPGDKRDDAAELEACLCGDRIDLGRARWQRELRTNTRCSTCRVVEYSLGSAPVPLR